MAFHVLPGAGAGGWGGRAKLTVGEEGAVRAPWPAFTDAAFCPSWSLTRVTFRVFVCLSCFSPLPKHVPRPEHVG